MVEALTSITESGIDTNSSKLPLPFDCNYFKNYPYKKVKLAASDSHLCIAHFRENSDCISFEFIDKSDNATLICVKEVDSKFFRLFSCLGGVVFQVGEKGYQAFKTVDGKVQLVDRWEIVVPNVQGFFYHKGAFQHHFYTISTTSNWNWQFADNLYNDMTYAPVERFAVSSNVNPNMLYAANWICPNAIGIYMKLQRGYIAAGAWDAQTVQPVTNIVFQILSKLLFVIAYSISKNEVRFAYSQFISDSLKNVQTFSKTVNLKSVLDIQFFNSDCYFLTQKGNAIRRKNFFF